MEAQIEQRRKHRCVAAASRRKKKIHAFVFKAISYFKVVSSISIHAFVFKAISSFKEVSLIHLYFTFVSFISILIENIKKMFKENVQENKNKSFVLFQQVTTKTSCKKIIIFLLFAMAFVYLLLGVRTNEFSMVEESRVKILVQSQYSLEHEMIPLVFETGYFDYGIYCSKCRDKMCCIEECGFFNTSILNYIEMGTNNYDVSLFNKHGKIVIIEL